MVKPPSVVGQVMNIGQTLFEAMAMLVRNVTVSIYLEKIMFLYIQCIYKIIPWHFEGQGLLTNC